MMWFPNTNVPGATDQIPDSDEIQEITVSHKAFPWPMLIGAGLLLLYVISQPAKKSR